MPLPKCSKNAVKNLLRALEALRDEVYKSKDNYVGDGVSWLHRWSLTQGKDFVLEGKPQVPDFVSKAA